MPLINNVSYNVMNKKFNVSYTFDNFYTQGIYM